MFPACAGMNRSPVPNKPSPKYAPRGCGFKMSSFNRLCIFDVRWVLKQKLGSRGFISHPRHRKFIFLCYCDGAACSVSVR